MKKPVFFLEENLYKNTKTKTKSDMKVITDFFISKFDLGHPSYYSDEIRWSRRFSDAVLLGTPVILL